MRFFSNSLETLIHRLSHNDSTLTYASQVIQKFDDLKRIYNALKNNKYILDLKISFTSMYPLPSLVEIEFWDIETKIKSILNENVDNHIENVLNIG